MDVDEVHRRSLMPLSLYLVWFRCKSES